jgi:hypothetical protein
VSNPIVVVGVADVLRRIRYLRYNIADKRVMSEIGLFFITKIQKRTAEGKDVDETPFTPYSPAYRRKREKNQRSGTKVNLFWTGSMMSSMTLNADKDSVKLFFQNTTAPNTKTPNPDKAFFLNQERRFFAISESDRQGALDIIDNHIRRLRRRRR